MVAEDEAGGVPRDSIEDYGPEKLECIQPTVIEAVPLATAGALSLVAAGGGADS